MSCRDIVITFSPTVDDDSRSTAVCLITGRVSPLMLSLAGKGKAPDVAFSFQSLNFGCIVATELKYYELVIQNKSEIDAIFSASLGNDVLQLAPQEGIITPFGYQAIRIALQSNKLGFVNEAIQFCFDGCSAPKKVSIR